MSNLLTGRCILVVEDEFLLLMMIEDQLADLGCLSVISAATVKQALHLIVSHDLDAAMLDVNLNGEKSFPVADVLSALGVPFAFSTGYSRDTLVERHRDRPILNKPYRAADIIELFTNFSFTRPSAIPPAA